MRKIRNIPDEKRNVLKMNHRLFQVCVEAMANHLRESPWTKFSGIFFSEGGVLVNGMEIRILKGHVCAEGDADKEERAVTAAYIW